MSCISGCDWEDSNESSFSKLAYKNTTSARRWKGETYAQMLRHWVRGKLRIINEWYKYQELNSNQSPWKIDEMFPLESSIRIINQPEQPKVLNIEWSFWIKNPHARKKELIPSDSVATAWICALPINCRKTIELNCSCGRKLSMEYNSKIRILWNILFSHDQYGMFG